ncbi:hypothetical protein GCM10022408_10010 [Hymenobacter fastidiosus]|uniref:SAVED domain-containing protein n=1 Tax=Hymenobacter fastidiosus TaxID=486264 RepID=A0ABP7RQQ1_9BACT
MTSPKPKKARAQPTATSDKDVADKRKKPTAKVQRQLYVQAGGQCQFCRTPVLETADSGYYAFNRGEMAHIVGQSLHSSSPRGNFPLPKAERDEVDNFMLLCSTHHTIIDNPAAQKDFPVELLREIKRKHEDHIHHVTGLPHSNHTCVVRLLGRIRGNTVQLTRPECNSATLQHNPPRFADFALDLYRQGTEIDLCHLGEPEEDSEFYYKSVRRQVDQGLALIRQGVEEGRIEHLSVFGFARIPVLIYLGFSLGNKVGSTLFQRRRVDDHHWHWLPDVPPQTFVWQLIQSGFDPTRVAVILNISGSIHRQELPAHIDETYTVFLIKPADCDPHPDSVLSVESLNEFRKCYRRWLAHLEVKHKFAPAIHLFPAVPPAVAVACGLDLMPHTQPALVIYDRMPHDFAAALTIN